MIITPVFQGNVASILVSVLPITIQKDVIARNVPLILKKGSSCSAPKVHIRE
jgi:hypothetical protein